MSKLVFSKRDADDFTSYHNNKELDYSVGEWYASEYPTDELGRNVNRGISFNQLWLLMKYGVPFYPLIGVSDSLVRDRIFEALMTLFGISYDELYKHWH